MGHEKRDTTHRRAASPERIRPRYGSQEAAGTPKQQVFTRKRAEKNKTMHINKK